MGMSEYMKSIRNKVGHSLLQMPSVTIINFDDEGRVLLLKHRDTNLWVAAGGAIEPGESPADSAKREMWEETGLVVELVDIIGVYGGRDFVVEYSNGDQTSYVMTIFEGRTIGGELKPIDDESIEFGYFTYEESSALEMQPWLKVVLPDILVNKGRKRTLFQTSSWKPEDETDKLS